MVRAGLLVYLGPDSVGHYRILLTSSSTSSTKRPWALPRGAVRRGDEYAEAALRALHGMTGIKLPEVAEEHVRRNGGWVCPKPGTKHGFCTWKTVVVRKLEIEPPPDVHAAR